MDPYPVVYETKNPAMPGKTFCAFLVRDVPELDKDGEPTGNLKADNLPMVFWGTSPEDVADKARDFWTTETARIAAKKEQGKRLAERQNKKGKRNATE